MTVSERQPWRAGSAWKLGQLRMVKPGMKPRQLGRVGAAQHVADEEAVPGELGDDADVQPVGGVGAGVEILHEELAAADVGAHVGEQPAEVLGRHRRVVLPPDVRHDRGLADDELVLGAAAGVAAGGDQQRAADAEVALAAGDGRLHQRGLEQVVVHLRHAGKAGRLERHPRIDPSCTLNTVVIASPVPSSSRRQRRIAPGTRAAPQHAQPVGLYNTRAGRFRSRITVNWKCDVDEIRRARCRILFGSVFGCVRVAPKGKDARRAMAESDESLTPARLGGGVRRPRGAAPRARRARASRRWRWR